MRILVAEDEKNLNRILTEALTDEGYSVDPCFDGQEAWDALACAEYDVLVLDIMMPRMDGLTLVRALRESGCTIEERHDVLRISCAGRLKALERVTTGPYPGFPTDAQAPLMAGLLRAEGRTEFVETIFENRLRHAEQLRKMGADIRVDGRKAVVTGVERLNGAELLAEDLRGGAALVIAALSAEGKSSVSGVKHIKRGYDRLEENLKSLGADIKTVEIS